MSTSTTFLNLFVNSSNAKRVAVFLIIGYVTFKLWKSFQPKSCENTSENAKNTNNKESNKGIPTTQTSVLISSAGSRQINGEYRWFLNSGSWCFFNEDDNKGYTLKSNVRINENDALFEKIKHKTSDSNKYFTICDIEGSVVYYVAAQKYEEYIPNDCNEWIAVHGKEPSPNLYVNLMSNASEPNEEDEFGNANMPKINDVSVDKMEVVKEEEEVEDDGDISDLDTNDNNKQCDEGQGNGVEEEEEEDSDVSDLEA